jgi:hypothetical protein
MVSFYIESNCLIEAMNTLEKCEKIAEHFNLVPLKVKLSLLKASLLLKRNLFTIDDLNNSIS